MSTRVYVPASLSLLARFTEEGGIGPTPVYAHAVTAWLRAAWPEADQEEWEYAALMAAAATSAGLRGAGDLPRRYVIAADVPGVVPVPGDDPTLVDVAADLPMKNVAAAHVDTRDDADDDEDLAWYATQEIPDLLG